MTNLLLTIASLFAISSFTMEAASHDDKPLRARDVNEAYKQAAISATQSYPYASIPGELVVGSLLGSVLSSDEYVESFFPVNNIFEVLPAESQKIYEFFRQNNFFTTLGKVNVGKLKRDRVTDFRLLKVKTSAMSAPPESDSFYLHIVPHTKTPLSLFHHVENGFLFRKKSGLLKKNSDPRIAKLFTSSSELDKVLQNIVAINAKAHEKQSTINEMLHKNDLPGNIIQALINSELVSDSMTAFLKGHVVTSMTWKEKAQFIADLRRISLRLLSDFEARKDTIAELVPSPIDITMLFGFYIATEFSKHFLDDKMEEVALLVAYLFVAKSNDEIIELLSPHAYATLRKLGYGRSYASTKKMKTSSRSTNVVLSLTPKMPVATNAEATASTPAEPSPKGVDDEETGRTSSREEKSCDNASNDSGKEKEKEKEKEEDTASGIKLASLTDERHPKNLYLKRQKGHRLLDTLARLLTAELGGSGHYPGSLSVALVPHGDKERFAVSTKNDIPAQALYRAMNNVIKFSRFATEDADDVDATIFRAKSVAASINFANFIDDADKSPFHEAMKVFNSRRSIVDKLKFHRAITVGHADEISQRFKNAFTSKLQLEVVENPFRFHSEIVLTTHLLDNGYVLAIIPGTNIPYQYLGGSIKSCGQCTALIKGAPGCVGLNQSATSKRMAIFLRGHYSTPYSGYVFPEWAVACNACSFSKLRYRVNTALPMPAKYPSPVERTAQQTTELSDSDDDF